MKNTEIYQALTLWFVAAIFLQTNGTSDSGPLGILLGVSAVAILYLIPVYLFGSVLTSTLDAERSIEK
ncbi:hypothetical protein [Natrinema salinisoli]|uniref:hypothetical protein n=1 Tax=Natrinema salinisoli TaxID=2878535 RepID=UPI001CF08644|nr:hypothetical protein [Natrinema salinisoli]